MKHLKWLLLIFSATMNTSISGGSLLQKSIFSWFPYLHKTLVAVKEQDVHISRKYTCVRVMIMEGVKQQKGKSLSLCFVLFWNHKSHSCYPQVTFDIYSLCYCFKRWPPKEKQGLGTPITCDTCKWVHSSQVGLLSWIGRSIAATT